jgi:hypothetical protein
MVNTPPSPKPEVRSADVTCRGPPRAQMATRATLRQSARLGLEAASSQRCLAPAPAAQVVRRHVSASADVGPGQGV